MTKFIPGEDFIPGKDLFEDFGWKRFQYFDCFQEGLLQPHDLDTGHRIIDLNTEYGKKIIETFEQTPPKTLEEYEKIMRVREIRFWEQHGGWIKSNKSLRKIKEKARILYTDRLLSLNNCIRKSFKLSRDRKEAKEQFREAKKWLFKEDEVLAFKKKHGLDRSAKHTSSGLPEIVKKPVDLSANIEKEQPVLYDNEFKLLGDYWYIRYQGGESFQIKDLKGIHYIVFLLANQGKEFDLLKMESLFDGLPIAESNETDLDTIKAIDGMDDERLEKEEGLSRDELLQPIEYMTKKDINKFKSIADNVWERSKSGYEKDIKEWENCKSFLKKDYGIFPSETKKGELKFKFKARLKADAERARKNISKNIKYAIQKIKEKDRDLAGFLSEYIHTGNLIRYTPSDIINWHIIK